MTNSMMLLGILVAMALMLTSGDQVFSDDDLFDEYDGNEDGFVAPEEIADHLDAGIVTINNYVAAYDSDNDGELNREEFAAFAAFVNI